MMDVRVSGVEHHAAVAAGVARDEGFHGHLGWSCEHICPRSGVGHMNSTCRRPMSAASALSKRGHDDEPERCDAARSRSTHANYVNVVALIIIMNLCYQDA